jgi:hypothetical protein
MSQGHGICDDETSQSHNAAATRTLKAATDDHQGGIMGSPCNAGPDKEKANSHPNKQSTSQMV